MNVRRFDTVDSTNELAQRLVRDGTLTEMTYLTARVQTHGKGTLGRGWQSPRDAGLYLTVVQPALPHTGPVSALFTLAAGIAAVETLADLCGLRARLKCVNDIIVAGGKLGGILVEGLCEEGRLTALLTGVGMNLRSGAVHLPEPAEFPPTALQDHVPADVFAALDPQRLSAELAERIVAWNERVLAGDGAAVETRWQQHVRAPAASTSG